MTQPDYDLLLDLSYYRDQRLDDPLALARYADAHNQRSLAIVLRLAALCICDGEHDIRIPRTFADKILHLATQRLESLHHLATLGLVSPIMAPDDPEITYFTPTNEGVRVLGSTQHKPCPDQDGAAPPRG